MTDYVTVSDATAYFGVTKHLYGAAWTSATNDEKAAVINMAQNRF